MYEYCLHVVSDQLESLLWRTSIVYLVESNYSIRRIATAIADWGYLARYAVSYLHYTLCACERLRSTSRVLVAEMALLYLSPSKTTI